MLGIVDIIKNITCMIILVSFLRQILPKGKNESYLKYFAGFIIILTLVTPIMKLLSGYETTDIINRINEVLVYNEMFEGDELENILNENEEKAKKAYEAYVSGVNESDDNDENDTFKIEEITIGE